MSFSVPNQHRVHTGDLGSTDDIGNNGFFYLQGKSSRDDLKIIASDGGGWEHVSVSKKYVDPTWSEMCRIKDMFWGPEDVVIQYHPAHSSYVNNSKHCLHLFRPSFQVLPRPPAWMVGIKSLGQLG